MEGNRGCKNEFILHLVRWIHRTWKLKTCSWVCKKACWTFRPSLNCVPLYLSCPSNPLRTTVDSTTQFVTQIMGNNNAKLEWAQSHLTLWSRQNLWNQRWCILSNWFHHNWRRVSRKCTLVLKEFIDKLVDEKYCWLLKLVVPEICFYCVVHNIFVNTFFQS